MLKRLMEVAAELRQMVVSDKWRTWVEGLNRNAAMSAQEVANLILDLQGFWKRMQEACDILQPMFAVLISLESDRPVIGEVYAKVAQVGDIPPINLCAAYLHLMSTIFISVALPIIVFHTYSAYC